MPRYSCELRNSGGDGWLDDIAMLPEVRPIDILFDSGERLITMLIFSALNSATTVLRSDAS